MAELMLVGTFLLEWVKLYIDHQSVSVRGFVDCLCLEVQRGRLFFVFSFLILPFGTCCISCVYFVVLLLRHY